MINFQDKNPAYNVAIDIFYSKAESLRTSTTALPGAPLTSFFDSLSPLQKQLLLQQQFQQVSPAIANQNSNSASFPSNSLENSLLNLQGTENIWFSVGIVEIRNQKYISFIKVSFNLLQII